MSCFSLIRQCTRSARRDIQPEGQTKKEHASDISRAQSIQRSASAHTGGLVEIIQRTEICTDTVSALQLIDMSSLRTDKKLEMMEIGRWRAQRAESVCACAIFIYHSDGQRGDVPRIEYEPLKGRRHIC